MSALLLLACVTPILLAPGVLRPHWYRALLTLALLPPLAVLGLAAAGGGAEQYPLVVLGLEWRLDGLARRLLPVVAAVWLAAAWRLRRRSPGRPFLACFLLCMGGSLGAVPAANGAGYYVFFSIASIAAYGLIVSGRHARAAGRLYLGLALLGEFLFLAGVILAVAGRRSEWVGWLIFFGLGAKLGVLPLHVALPPAYRAATVSGGALLGGALTTVAIAGWLRFLPLAGPALPSLGQALVWLGLAAALGGALLGTLQSNARALLGYSTVSQMGIVTAGVGLAAGEEWARVLPALVLFAAHHGLVKGALLLGTGVVGGERRGLVLLLLVLLSLALSGVPLSGGALAKGWLEAEAEQLHGLGKHLVTLLPFTSAATFVLMARYLWLVSVGRQGGRGRAAPFVALGLVALLLPWGYLWLDHPHPAEIAFGLKHLKQAAWPTLLGAAAVGVAVLIAWRGPRRWRQWVPAGDLAVWLSPLVSRLWRVLLSPPRAAALPRIGQGWARALEALEGQLLRVSVAGLLYLILVITLGWLAAGA